MESYNRLSFKLSVLVSLLLCTSSVLAEGTMRYGSSVANVPDIESNLLPKEKGVSAPAPAPQVYDDCVGWLNAGHATSGIYTLTGDRQVYCDMVSHGGGWMLYVDFGSSTARPALLLNSVDTGEELNQVNESRYISSFNTSSISSGGEYWIDEYRQDWVNFHYGAETQGYISVTAPSGYSQMRVDYGNGYWYYKNYSLSFVMVKVNNTIISRAYQPASRGEINQKQAIFSITGGESVSVAESNSVSYLNAIWVK